MKKSFAVAAFALAGAMCCGLAGCGAGGSDAGGSGAGGSGDKGVFQQAQDCEGYEVTEEQWAAAFALFENPFAAEGTEYTVNGSYKIDANDAETGKYLGSFVLNDKFILKGNKAWTWEKYNYDYEDENEQGEKNSYYEYAIEDGFGVFYAYYQGSDNTWNILITPDVDIDYSDMGEACAMALSLSNGLMSEVYSDFTYNADKKGYVGSRIYGKDEIGGEDEIYFGEGEGEKVVKFDEEGRLIAIYTDTPTPVKNQVGRAAIVITYEAQDFDLPAAE